MTDHMWKPVEEGVPDGCSKIEVMFEDNSIGHCCSCDYHWAVALKQKLPIYYRMDIEDMDE
jgi:hypothetical protein